MEEKFWDELRDILEDSEADDLVDWFLKVLNYLDKQKKSDSKRKRKKLTKLFRENAENVLSAVEYFNDFLTNYDFKQELLNFITSFIPNFENIYILGTLNNTFKQNCSELQDSVRIAENISDSSEQDNIGENNIAEVIDGRLKGKFVSPNVINLSTRILSKAEISLLSKGLKFIPAPTSVNKALIKKELQCFGRKLRLLWHFRNEESITISNPFKKKSTFNPKGKDAAIELSLSRLEEEIISIDTKLSCSNLTKEERLVLNSSRDDTSIIIKEADKGSVVVVWDREDYLKEAEKQLGDKETYEELSSDPVSSLISIVKGCLSRVKNRGDIPNETLKYFFINKPKLGRFYLLPKIHKRLHNVLVDPLFVIVDFLRKTFQLF